MMGDDYLGAMPPSALSMQASVGGGVGNVMNLLDLDIDEPVQGSSSGVEDQLGDLNLGSQNANYLGSQNGNYLAGLDFGAGGASSSSSNFGSMGDQGLVQPKQVLLNAKNAQGLEIHGTFARRGGRVFLDMTFWNKAMQPLFDFAFQFNNNTFGLVPAGGLEIRSPLLPNTSAETSLQLTFSPSQRTPKTPINMLQIAVKNNVSIFYFQCNVHLHILFPENGGLERSDYLRQWKEIPETNEHDIMISQLKFPKYCLLAAPRFSAFCLSHSFISFRFCSLEAIRSKLSLNNVFIVAERQVEDRVQFSSFFSLVPFSSLTSFFSLAKVLGLLLDLHSSRPQAHLGGAHL